jgi:hypothetical protein
MRARVAMWDGCSLVLCLYILCADVYNAAVCSCGVNLRV